MSVLVAQRVYSPDVVGTSNISQQAMQLQEAASEARRFSKLRSRVTMPTHAPSHQQRLPQQTLFGPLQQQVLVKRRSNRFQRIISGESKAYVSQREEYFLVTQPTDIAPTNVKKAVPPAKQAKTPQRFDFMSRRIPLQQQKEAPPVKDEGLLAERHRFRDAMAAAKAHALAETESADTLLPGLLLIPDASHKLWPKAIRTVDRQQAGKSREATLRAMAPSAVLQIAKDRSKGFEPTLWPKAIGGLAVRNGLLQRRIYDGEDIGLDGSLGSSRYMRSRSPSAPQRRDRSHDRVENILLDGLTVVPGDRLARLKYSSLASYPDDDQYQKAVVPEVMAEAPPIAKAQAPPAAVGLYPLGERNMMMSSNMMVSTSSTAMSYRDALLSTADHPAPHVIVIYGNEVMPDLNESVFYPALNSVYGNENNLQKNASVTNASVSYPALNSVYGNENVQKNASVTSTAMSYRDALLSTADHPAPQVIVVGGKKAEKDGLHGVTYKDALLSTSDHPAQLTVDNKADKIGLSSQQKSSQKRPSQMAAQKLSSKKASKPSAQRLVVPHHHPHAQHHRKPKAMTAPKQRKLLVSSPLAALSRPSQVKSQGKQKKIAARRAAAHEHDDELKPREKGPAYTAPQEHLASSSNSLEAEPVLLEGLPVAPSDKEAQLKYSSLGNMDNAVNSSENVEPVMAQSFHLRSCNFPALPAASKSPIMKASSKKKKAAKSNKKAAKASQQKPLQAKSHDAPYQQRTETQEEFAFATVIGGGHDDNDNHGNDHEDAGEQHQGRKNAAKVGGDHDHNDSHGKDREDGGKQLRGRKKSRRNSRRASAAKIDGDDSHGNGHEDAGEQHHAAKIGGDHGDSHGNGHEEAGEQPQGRKKSRRNSRRASAAKVGGDHNDSHGNGHEEAGEQPQGRRKSRRNSRRNSEAKVGGDHNDSHGKDREDGGEQLRGRKKSRRNSRRASMAKAGMK